MDPRTDIFTLKLVYNQNVTLFGRLDNEVQRFEYLVFLQKFDWDLLQHGKCFPLAL
jgi:hypothetical protein